MDRKKVIAIITIIGLIAAARYEQALAALLQLLGA